VSDVWGPDSAPLPNCPVCDGKLEVVYYRHGQTVAVCVECHSGVTIPASAQGRLQVKQAKKAKGQ